MNSNRVAEPRDKKSSRTPRLAGRMRTIPPITPPCAGFFDTDGISHLAYRHCTLGQLSNFFDCGEEAGWAGVSLVAGTGWCPQTPRGLPERQRDREAKNQRGKAQGTQPDAEADGDAFDRGERAQHPAGLLL